MLRSIREEAAALRDAGAGASPGRARKIAVLAKLETLFAPERPVVARRGAREPTALPVEVVVGVSRIMRMLRQSSAEPDACAPRSAASGDDVTIAGFGATAEGSTIGLKASTGSPASGAGVASGVLTMADRSDSGCRLHGPALATTRTAPGTLIAFRTDAASPWTLAIARRVRKRLAGKRIEIGAEYLGKAPRLVVVVQEAGVANSIQSGDNLPRFGALYLTESTEHPVLPMKTLILPARGILPGARLSVRSRTSIQTIQLRQPLEEQAEFIWSPFDFLEHRVKDDPALSEAPAT